MVINDEVLVSISGMFIFIFIEEAIFVFINIEHAYFKILFISDINLDTF